jgi:hypothetical protein
MNTFLRVLGIILVSVGCLAVGAVGGCFAGAMAGTAVPQRNDPYSPLFIGAAAGAIGGAVLGGLLAARLLRPRE